MKALQRRPVRLLRGIPWDDGIHTVGPGSTSFRGLTLVARRMPGETAFHLCFGRNTLKTDAVEGVDFAFIATRPG